MSPSRSTSTTPPPDASANGSKLTDGDSPAAATSPKVVPAPPRTRRRRSVIAAGVALVALGGLAAAWLTTVVGNTSPVLVLSSDVTRGDVLSQQDLTVAQLPADPALSPVPAADRPAVVGQRAAVDLAAGTLLTPTSVTSEVLPADGSSLLGVALIPAQLPARALRPGDQVRVVDTPRDQDDPPTGDPVATRATVVATRALPDTGQTVVDLTVPSEQAAGLAARVATGRVALVVDGDRG